MRSANIGGMHGNLSGRKLEYQPTTTSVDMRVAEDVTKK